MSPREILVQLHELAAKSLWLVASGLAFFGTVRAAQTRLVSSAVAVIENSEDDSAQSGTSAPGPSWTTAIFSGNCSSR